MFPASTKAGGQCLGAPDVCKTPAAPSPIPLPYPNSADLSGADKVISKVLIEKKETVVEDSKVPRTKGDEPGTLKGVVSSDDMGEVDFKTYSSKVYAKGKKIVHHTATTSHNGSNANVVGAHISPSQTKVIIGG
jgi:Domain of unknown function (DUF4150)